MKLSYTPASNEAAIRGTIARRESVWAAVHARMARPVSPTEATRNRRAVTRTGQAFYRASQARTVAWAVVMASAIGSPAWDAARTVHADTMRAKDVARSEYRAARQYAR